MTSVKDLALHAGLIALFITCGLLLNTTFSDSEMERSTVKADDVDLQYDTIDGKTDVTDDASGNEVQDDDQRRSYLRNPDYYSPEVFFHVYQPITTDITLTIPDGITLTIPEVPMDTTATWEDVTAKADGTCTYQGTDHPYLYYEGIWEYPESNYGWVVDREAMTDEQILDLVFKKCLDSRLEPNEAQVIIDRMVNLDMLETDSTHLAIRYIPEEDVDATMQLETSEDFHIMRRHFLIEDADTHISLLEPEFEPAPEGDLIIHETAVNRG